MRFIPLLLVALLALLLCPANGQPAITDVSFQQVNYLYRDFTVAQNNSLWGQMTYSYAPEDATSYLNVVATTSLGGNEAWVIQNMPLFAVDNYDYSTRSEIVDIDLSELGLAEGEEWTDVYYVISVDPDIRTTAPTGATTPGTISHFDRVDFDAVADDLPATSDFYPGSPIGIKLTSAPVAKTKTKAIPEVQEGDYRCFAGAMARSLGWLNAYYKLGINRTPEEIYLDLLARGVSIVSQPTARENRTEWLKEKDAYIRGRTNNRVITRVNDPYDLYNPIPTVTEVTADLLNWIRAELNRGEDVELEWYWRQRNTTHDGAHIVTVVDVFDDDEGNTWIQYRDDEEQGDPNKGDKAVKTRQVVKVGDDYYFGDNETIRWLTAAISESLAEWRRCDLAVTLTQIGWREYCEQLVFNKFHLAFADYMFNGVLYHGKMIVGGRNTIEYDATTPGIVRLCLFLPQDGPCGKLRRSYCNPWYDTEAGLLAGEVIALTMNVAYNNNMLMPREPGVQLDAYILAKGPYKGMTVARVLSIANAVLGGTPPCVYGLPDCETLVEILQNINANYEFISMDLFIDRGYLIPVAAPVPPV